jgi:hypothetical protein
MISGNLAATNPSSDRSDATVMACGGAVVWRFDVPRIKNSREKGSSAQHLVVNEELVMLRSLATELVQVVTDQRTLLVACEEENATLQRAVQVQSLEVATQTIAIASAVSTEHEQLPTERKVLEQSVSELKPGFELRRKLAQPFERDATSSSATQRVSQLEQERTVTQERTSHKFDEYEAQIQQLKLQHVRQQQALREAVDALKDGELKNVMLHELVKQLEISNARLETERFSASERYSSLRAVVSALEDRAEQAERQHKLLLQKIRVELEGIRATSPSQ